MARRFSRHLASAILLTAVLSSAAIAQSAKQYTLEQCIQTGLANNAGLRRSIHDIDRAAAVKRQAFGSFLPSLNANGSWTRSSKEAVRTISPTATLTSKDSYSYSIGSSLTLFDGLANIHTADRSVLGMQSAEMGVARSKQSTVFLVQQDFYNALRLQQLVKVNQSNLERSKKQLERIKELNAVGSVPLADVYRQQVQVGQDELRLLQAQNSYDDALIDLQTLLGVKPDAEFDIDPGDSAAPLDAGEVASYRSGLGSTDKLALEAMRSRSDFLAADVAVRSTEKSVSIARAGHYPSLTASAGYSWSNIELKNFTGEDYGTFSYGLQLSVPLFNGFAVSSAVQLAEVDRMNAETGKLELQRSISGSVQKAYNAVTLAEKNLEISNRTLTSAQEDQRIANERYTLGAGTLLDLIVANTNLTAAQSDVVNATFDYRIARKALEYQVGTTPIPTER